MEIPLAVVAILALACVVITSSVVVRARHRQEAADPFQHRTMIQRPIDKATVLEVNRLLSEGEMAMAIKVYREATGLSPGESRRAIEDWNLRNPDASHPEYPQPELRVLDERTESLVRLIISSKGKNEAIKWVRDHTGAGRVEAKFIVERLE